MSDIQPPLKVPGPIEPDESSPDALLPATLSVHSRADLGRSIITLEGELDLATAPKVIRAVKRFGTKRSGICLDLSRVTFVDVAGLRALIAIHHDCANEQRALVIIHSPALDDLLDHVDLVGILAPSLSPSASTPRIGNEAPHVTDR